MSNQSISIHDLTEKKRRYVRARLSNQGKSRRNAALEAGYSESVANKVCTHVETPDVKAVFRDMIQKKISSDRIAQRISEGIDAEKTEFFSKDGVVTDQRNTVAWAERRAYLELAAEYAGYVTHEQEPTTHLHVIGMLQRTVPVPDQTPVQGPVHGHNVKVVDVPSEPKQ